MPLRLKVHKFSKCYDIILVISTSPAHLSAEHMHILSILNAHV